MSLEKVIEEGLAAVVAAIKENTEVAKTALDKTVAAVSAEPAKKVAKKKTAKSKKSAEEKPAETEPEATETPAEEVEVVTDDEEVTILMITEYVKARFTNVEDSMPLKEKFAKLREDYGVTKASEIPEDKLAKFYADTKDLMPESGDTK